jgi:hypothetical protein
MVEHLAPLLHVEHGLALGSPSERIDFPMRSLRLAGHLATAGSAAFDLGNQGAATRFGDVLEAVFTRNQGGALSPVLDDQVVELALVWDLWRRLGRADLVTSTARGLVHRLALRRQFDLPLPALWLPTAPRLNARTVRILVDAHFHRSPPGFEQGGSQILPLALYLGWSDPHDPEAESILVTTGPGAAGSPDLAQSQTRQPEAVFLQSWLPPDDAPRNWYGESLAHRGNAYVYPSQTPFAAFRQQFERFNRPLSTTSEAERIGLPTIDRIAWKIFRNPPPLALFVSGTSY